MSLQEEVLGREAVPHEIFCKVIIQLSELVDSLL